ncbi:MAG: type I methionyl aminopeptidase [Dehalococcoidales bacterium]|jgi:methionyl aminopeptidase|nr:type I methionyl aminopeptidase [Dehalococcoidales bacterium]MDP6647172.1 type I methionyl aminopeptidase [Dehalococcoidales bacterium]MDP6737854.1 type I methionyl aminopeptidase [Dehalococcoidales bacterium]MDP7309581.1 type I methionyl aminopeptidase [Dehalococcoidales bacterium]MDP7675821.1 type I methionyl aminopeptidase [Dehalococcoidales bacterium]|tara:strand:+ start:371 stop:1120 length:750 start_codon:yes stop_codon:yes gene_type:complete
MGIIIKSEPEITAMRQAGKIVATVLEALRLQMKPGMQTEELDVIAAREVTRLGAKPSFKGYRGFPANLCVSVNDEIVHGIPGGRVLREDDIISIDFGAIFHGFQGDAAITVGMGHISPEAQRLITTTDGALKAGIAAVRHGARLGDISAAIQHYAEERGYSVVREYTGHGIGRAMHEDPLIPNFGLPGEGPVLKKGMALAIEPMVNIGDWRTTLSDNNWTVSTSDGSLSAHFEHTIAVTNGEAEVLTAL